MTSICWNSNIREATDPDNVNPAILKRVADDKSVLTVWESLTAEGWRNRCQQANQKVGMTEATTIQLP